MNSLSGSDGSITSPSRSKSSMIFLSDFESVMNSVVGLHDSVTSWS